MVDKNTTIKTDFGEAALIFCIFVVLVVWQWPELPDAIIEYLRCDGK